MNDGYIKGIANIFYWKYLRQGKVNLLVYGPNRPYFKQKQKNNITKFWPTWPTYVRYMSHDMIFLISSVYHKCLYKL